MPDLTLDPAARLAQIVRDEPALVQMLEDYADVEGIIDPEGARVFWQKLFFARLGHSPSEQIGGIEKLLVVLACETNPADPALVGEGCEQAIEVGSDVALEAWEKLQRLPPTYAFMTIARLCGMTAEALRAHA